MKILAIDPSVNNVGIALFNSELEADKQLKTYTYKPDGKTLQCKCVQVLTFCRCMYVKPDIFIAEYPSFQGSTKGKVAAQKGYTLDLAYIVGYLSASFGLPFGHIYLPTPMQWKGTMPKSAVGHRFEKVYGIKASSVTDHEFEAAMMIDWFLKKI